MLSGFCCCACPVPVRAMPEHCSFSGDNLTCSFLQARCLTSFACPQSWIEGWTLDSSRFFHEIRTLYEGKWRRQWHPNSSALAWKIPWMEETDRLQSMGLLRVIHDWATSLSLFTFMHWRRKWQPTPTFLLGESQGWGRTESDTIEVT